MLSQTSLRASRVCWRCYATTASTPPPMLLKIRKDLKIAMQNKDSSRLSVLRSLLTQTLNASKTSTPISTDMQMLALLRKTANASKAASAEFKGAGRDDLAEKEEQQLKIMEEYAGSVETVGEDEIRQAVREVVKTLTESSGKAVALGEVLKACFSKEVLGDKPVEKGEVAKIVKEILSEGKS